MSARYCGKRGRRVLQLRGAANPGRGGTATCQNPDLLAQGRRNALRFARERFNWQVQSETLLALYRVDTQSEALALLAEEASQVSA